MRIEKQVIERIIIHHVYEELVQAFEYCENRGYKIVRSGPAQLTTTMDKQLIIAEKVVGYESLTDSPPTIS